MYFSCFSWSGPSGCCHILTTDLASFCGYIFDIHLFLLFVVVVVSVSVFVVQGVYRIFVVVCVVVVGGGNVVLAE